MKFGVQENHKYLHKFIRGLRPTYVVITDSATFELMTDGVYSNRDKSINKFIKTYMKDNSNDSNMLIPNLDTNYPSYRRLLY